MIRRALILAVTLGLAGCLFTFDRKLSSGEVRGQVVFNAAGSGPVPAAGARVVLEDSSIAVLADSQGRFSISNLPPGTYAIDFTSAPAGSATATSGLRKAGVIVNPVGAALGDGRDLGQVPIGNFGRVVGTVTNVAAGTTGAVAVISGVVSGQVVSGIAQSPLSSTNTFTFSHTLPGDYQVSLFALPDQQHALLAAPLAVTVTPGETKQINLDLSHATTASTTSPIGSISGSAQFAGGSSAAGIGINFYSATVPASKLPTMIMTDSTGTFTAPNLPPGVYSVTAISGGSQSVSIDDVLVGAGTTTLPTMTVTPISLETDGGAESASDQVTSACENETECGATMFASEADCSADYGGILAGLQMDNCDSSLLAFDSLLSCIATATCTDLTSGSQVCPGAYQQLIAATQLDPPECAGMVFVNPSGDGGMSGDGGFEFDSGMSGDAGQMGDGGGGEFDGGVTLDSGPASDAGQSVDAGIEFDGGLFFDAGPQNDAGQAFDSGPAIDAGGSSDAGMTADAGMPFDAGRSKDGGMTPDAGLPVDAGPPDSGVEVITFSGDGDAGYVDGTGGPNGTAEFWQPWEIGADQHGNLYVADSTNNRIRKIDPLGNVTTFAGNGQNGFVDGTGGTNGTAEFSSPEGIAVDAEGYVYVADTSNNSVRKIDPSGNVTTLAGNMMFGSVNGTGGMGGTAEFALPVGIAVDLLGNVYVTDDFTPSVRRIDPAGNVTTFCGSGTSGSVDGPSGTAEFTFPSGVAVDFEGNVYVTDPGVDRIRKIDPTGNATTLAGNGTNGFMDGTGGPNGKAEFNSPEGITVDPLGNVYVEDYGDDSVRWIDPFGNVTTIAGNGSPGDVNGPGLMAQFNTPEGIVIDAQGNLFVSDEGNNQIREVIVPVPEVQDGGMSGLVRTASCSVINECVRALNPLTLAGVQACENLGTDSAQNAFNPLMSCAEFCAEMPDAGGCEDAVTADGGMCASQWAQCAIDGVSCDAIFGCLQTPTGNGDSGPGICVNEGTLSAKALATAYVDCQLGPCFGVDAGLTCVEQVIAPDGGACASQYAACISELGIWPSAATVAPKGFIQFTTVGGVSPFAFQLTSNGSGGSMTVKGRYTSGQTTGVGDVVTVTDSTGKSAISHISVESPDGG